MQQYRSFGVTGMGIPAGYGARAPPRVPALVPQPGDRRRQRVDVSAVSVDEHEPLGPFAGRTPEVDEQLFEDGGPNRDGTGKALVLTAGSVGDGGSYDEWRGGTGRPEGGDDGACNGGGDAGVGVQWQVRSVLFGGAHRDHHRWRRTFELLRRRLP